MTLLLHCCMFELHLCVFRRPGLDVRILSSAVLENLNMERPLSSFHWRELMHAIYCRYKTCDDQCVRAVGSGNSNIGQSDTGVDAVLLWIYCK